MKKLIYLIVLPVILCACVSRDDVRINGLDRVETASLTRPTLVFNVTNRSGRNLHLRDGFVTLEKGGRPVLEISLTGDITVPKRFDGEVAVPLRVKVTDPIFLLAASIGGNVITSDMTVSGEATGKVGMAKKKFRYEKVPLSRFLSNFGISQKELEKIIP